jgi:hypothetical protein
MFELEDYAISCLTWYDDYFSENQGCGYAINVDYVDWCDGDGDGSYYFDRVEDDFMNIADYR